MKIDDQKIHNDESHAFYFHDLPLLQKKVSYINRIMGSNEKKKSIRIKKINTKQNNNKISLDGIKYIVFDFDGVFTDNKVYVDSNGVETIRCDRADGMAIDLLRKFINKNNFKVKLLILSTEKDKATLQRARKLKINCVRGISNKYDYLLDRYGTDIFDKICYLGNDINDLDVMKYSRYSVSPLDAHLEIKRMSNFNLNTLGGQGFVRDFVEKLIN